MAGTRLKAARSRFAHKSRVASDPVNSDGGHSFEPAARPRRAKPPAERDARERAGDGDGELVGGWTGQALYLRGTPDRQQDDVAHDKSAPAGDKAVRELVHDDASEQHGDPRQARRDRRPRDRCPPRGRKRGPVGAGSSSGRELGRP